ncbi:hypothetical protein KY285_025512 [Solanum tuberosum]|nr:hypothetical protein KY285_025512 [Solanum tuberosum]
MEILLRGDHEGERVAYINENEFEAATTQLTASQSSPVGDPEDVALTQALTNTTATVDPETLVDLDQSTENSSDSDHEDLFNEGDVEYESDVHEENINLRDERRSYQRRKRTKRVPKDPEEVPVAEVGPNVGFDETEPVDKNLKDNERRRDSRRIVFHKTTEKLIRNELGIHVGKTTTRRARQRILQELMGDHVKEFGRIFYYWDELLRTNPSNTCVVKVDDSEGYYGCFLKGVTKGQLLVVVAKDANNQMLPTAWSVVEYENKNTWAWFLKLFIEDLGLGDGKDYTLISAMQKGLTSTVNHLLPEVEHRMCARHILANWAKDWRGLERRNQFWKCARSTFEAELKANLAHMALLDNNMVESFNAWILAPRHKTIIIMLEEIRVKVMNRLGGSYVHTVDMRSRTCSCKSWMLQGIPCPHAIAAILYKNWKPIDYVDDCYSKETYLRTYYHYLQPVTNMKMWLDSTNSHVEPPVVKSMPGRPRKVRNKERWESKKLEKLPRKGAYMTCSICHGKNHNKRSCPLKDYVVVGPSNEVGTSRAIPKPRGRPRKPPTTTEAPTATDGEQTNVNPDAPPRPRGRPRKTTNSEAPARGRGRTCEPITTSTIGRERDTTPDTTPTPIVAAGMSSPPDIALRASIASTVEMESRLGI